MIKISRGECPNKLKGSPPTGDHYKHRYVVAALLKMQHHKCCYCERRLPEEGHDKHVEHFRPKGNPDFSHLRNEWLNLLLVCPQCNGKKGDQFPVDSNDNPLIIDPSNLEMDPEGHIAFDVDVNDPACMGQAIEKNNSRFGQTTIKVTGIGSPFFKNEREEYFLTTIFPSFKNLWQSNKTGDAQQMRICRMDFEQLMSASSKFLAFVKAFARKVKLDEHFDLNIPA